jgi:hypothetical protein
MSSSRRFRLVLLAGLLLAGCEPTLETGYQPRTLKSSEADRRSYYAPPFSPAAQAETKGTGFNFAP